MPTVQFLKQTLTLILWAIGVEAAAFFYDLLFNQKVSNPFWDANYNWLPLIIGVTVTAVIITALRSYITTRRPALYRLADYVNDKAVRA